MNSSKDRSDLKWGSVRRSGTAGAGVRRRLLFGLAMGPWLGQATAQGSGPEFEARRRRDEDPLAVVWLRNIAGRAQEAGFVSPMFGQAFCLGDVPAGRHPQFTLADGMVCPATLWGISSWPDGSMKFCGVMLQVPRSMAVRERLAIHVRSGGPATASMGPRRVEDLLQADLRVELTGIDGLEGIWTASLNDAVRRGDDLVEIGNGAAGAVWRIGGELRDEKGAAHGQLYGWHYVAALNGAEGRLLGLRYLGRVAQPWVDVAAPAPRMRDFTARITSGLVLIRKLQGHADSETLGEVIRLPHYASFFTAGSDACWDFVQGGGSAARDCAVQVLIDVPYAQRSDVVPPLALVGNAQEPEVHHHPMGKGTMVRYMPQTGGRSDIGLVPLWCLRYMADQSLVNERAVRVNALVAAGWRIAHRKRSTRQIVVVSDLQPRYAGLGSIERSWRLYDNRNTGFASPSPNKSLWTEDVAHRPQPFLIAYVMSGEPQYLDLAIDSALDQINWLAPGVRTMVNTFPSQTPSATPWVGDRDIRIGADGPIFKCAGQMFIGGRVGAWGSRDTAMCALLPDIPPDGAAVRDYMRDILASMYGALLAYRDRMPREFSRGGLLLTQHNGGNDQYYESPWQHMYWSFSICWQSAVLKTPEADQVRQYFARFYARAFELFDLGCIVTYRMSQYDDAENLITRLEDAIFLGKRRLQFDAATNAVTVLPRQGNEMHDWTPTDGDVIGFSHNQLAKQPRPFPQFGRNKRLYVVNVRGQSFQLAATRGGAPLDILRDEVVDEFMGQLQKLDTRTMLSNDATYIALMRGLLVYHERLGDPVTRAAAVFDAKALAAGFDPSMPSQFNIADKNSPAWRPRRRPTS